jgi:hypothetical protein
MPSFGGEVKSSVPCDLRGHFFTNRGFSCCMKWSAAGDDGQNYRGPAAYRLRCIGVVAP